MVLLIWTGEGGGKDKNGFHRQTEGHRSTVALVEQRREERSRLKAHKRTTDLGGRLLQKKGRGKGNISNEKYTRI